jgi:hypothetical protein
LARTGYLLIAQRDLAPYKDNGIEPYREAIGFLDFLRELEGDDFPFKKFSEIRLEGLEEALFAAVPNEETLALDIKNRLKAAAADLESRLISIQIVFKERLIPGDMIWAEYRGRRLPIGFIFGSPHRETDIKRNAFFSTNFNLSSG